MADTPKLAVAMMVKNEAKVIQRALTSILQLQPELVVITDTGSTDDTVTTAGMFLQSHGIPFRIYSETFQDFGHNRTLLLTRCREHPEIDYVLMLDADDTIIYGEHFNAEAFKKDLNLPYYAVEHILGDTTYYLGKLTSNHEPFTYFGATHEGIDYPVWPAWVMSGSIQIFQHADSYRNLSGQKFIHDKELLKKELETVTEFGKKSRIFFYLARTHKALGEYSEAIECFTKHIEMNHWSEEVFHSHYELVKIYMGMEGEFLDQILYHAWKAQEIQPERAEVLFELKNYLGKRGMGLLAHFVTQKWQKCVPSSAWLFLDKSKYESHSTTVSGA